MTPAIATTAFDELLLDAVTDPHWRLRHGLIQVLLAWGETEARRREIEERLARIADSPRVEGVRRYLHMSAMGSSEDAPSEYARTKAAGERAVRGSRLAWTIFRPSVILDPATGSCRCSRRSCAAIPGTRRGTADTAPPRSYP